MSKPSKALSGFDIFAIITELKGKLLGSRVKKIYRKGRTFHFVLTKETNYTLVIAPNQIHLTNYKGNYPLDPGNFCMLLRKSLTGARLEGIEQHGFDRIVEIKFIRAKKEQTRYVIGELFSNGNLILLNENFGIIAPFRREEWKARTIREKLPYNYPPETRDLQKLSLADFSNLLSEEKSDVVRTLASKLGFGGLYAEEICARAGIQKDKKNFALSKTEIEKIYSNALNLFDEVTRSPYPVQIIKNDIALEVSPIKLVQFPETELKRFNSFNEACDEFFVAEEVSQISAREGKFRERIEHILENQQKNFANIGENIKLWKEEADQLSAQQDFNAAALLYDKIKKARRKIPGVQAAMQKTTEKLGSLKIEEKLPVKKEAKAKKWFEKFRAFRTSDGFLVVCGKDATTNEILIKKHTSPEDIAFHADITGAPFCVIKTEKKPVPETSLEEVAQIAASYSKAWQRNLGAIDVYWVKPEQLNKKAPAGEYVSHGAFMVYGKKNYFYKTTLGIAIGVDKEFNVIAGAVDFVKKNSMVHSVIVPGDEKSKDLAEKIKRNWLKKVSKEISEKLKPLSTDQIQKFIPAGKGRLKD